MKDGKSTIAPRSENTAIPSTQGAQSEELSKRLSGAILHSMDLLNKAGDKLISSIEKSEDYGELVGMAETLAKMMDSQAKVVASVGNAMNNLGANNGRGTGPVA